MNLNWRDRERARLGMRPLSGRQQAYLPTALAEPEIGDKLYDILVRSLVSNEQWQHAASLRSESAIEKLFLMALCSLMDERPIYFDFLNVEVARSVQNRNRLHVGQQVGCGNRRLDFVLAGFGSLIGVECDGRNYHDRTTAQVTRDKARDREILSVGIPVMHFGGSEIWADARACAAEAITLLTGVSRASE